eukprot:1536544-Amphidinium_carterae.1
MSCVETIFPFCLVCCVNLLIVPSVVILSCGPLSSSMVASVAVVPSGSVPLFINAAGRHPRTFHMSSVFFWYYDVELKDYLAYQYLLVCMYLIVLNS